MINLNEVLFLTPKNDVVIGRPFFGKGFRIESIYKNDHYSERKFKILKLFNKENRLFAFDKSLIKQYNKIVVSECAQISSVARYVYIYNGQSDIKAYFWNTLRGEYIEEVKKLQKMGIETYTFDQGDCQRYNMKYNAQPYPYLENIYFDSSEIKYDCYFCAADKDRLLTLIKLKNALKDQNISFNFKVLKEKHKNYSKESSDIEGIKLIDKFVDYTIVLKESSHASCIVELLMKGQSGYTLRTMESLFLNKKLITNNKNVVNESFYNPNNIFILDNNYDKIKKFLEIPYETVPKYEKEKYSCNSWMNRFFEVEK